MVYPKKSLLYIRLYLILHHKNLSKICKLTEHGSPYVRKHIYYDCVNAPRQLSEFMPSLNIDDLITVQHGNNRPIYHYVSILKKGVHDLLSYARYLTTLTHAYGFNYSIIDKELDKPHGYVASYVEAHPYPKVYRLFCKVAKIIGMPKDFLMTSLHNKVKEGNRKGRQKWFKNVHDRYSLKWFLLELCRERGWNWREQRNPKVKRLVHGIAWGDSHALATAVKEMSQIFNLSKPERQRLLRVIHTSDFKIVVPYQKNSYSLLYRYIKFLPLVHHDTLSRAFRRHGMKTANEFMKRLKGHYDPIKPVKVNTIKCLLPYITDREIEMVNHGHIKEAISEVLTPIRRRIKTRKDYVCYVNDVCWSRGVNMNPLGSELGRSSGFIVGAIKHDKVKKLIPKMQWLAKRIHVKPRLLITPLKKSQMLDTMRKHGYKNTSSTSMKELKAQHRDFLIRQAPKVHNADSYAKYIQHLARFRGFMLNTLSIKIGRSSSYLSSALTYHWVNRLLQPTKQVAKVLGFAPVILMTALFNGYFSVNRVYNRSSLCTYIDRLGGLSSYVSFDKLVTSPLSRFVYHDRKYLTRVFHSGDEQTVLQTLRTIAPYVFLSDWDCKILTIRAVESNRPWLTAKQSAFNHRLYIYAKLLANASHDTFSRLSLRSGHAHGYLDDLFFLKLTKSNLGLIRELIPDLSKRDVRLIRHNNNEPIQKALNKIQKGVLDRKSLLDYFQCLVYAHGYTLAQIDKYYDNSMIKSYSAITVGSIKQIKKLCEIISEFLGMNKNELLEPLAHMKITEYHASQSIKIPVLVNKIKQAVGSIAEQSWMSVKDLSRTLYHDPDEIENLFELNELSDDYELLKYLVKVSDNHSKAIAKILRQAEYYI